MITAYQPVAPYSNVEAISWDISNLLAATGAPMLSTIPSPGAPNEEWILWDILQNIGGGGPGTQVQSDWTQTNPALVDFIKNKPANMAFVENVSGASLIAKIAANTVSSKTQYRIIDALGGTQIVRVWGTKGDRIDTLGFLEGENDGASTFNPGQMGLYDLVADTFTPVPFNGEYLPIITNGTAINFIYTAFSNYVDFTGFAVLDNASLSNNPTFEIDTPVGFDIDPGSEQNCIGSITLMNQLTTSTFTYSLKQQTGKIVVQIFDSAPSADYTVVINGKYKRQL